MTDARNYYETEFKRVYNTIKLPSPFDTDTINTIKTGEELGDEIIKRVQNRLDNPPDKLKRSIIQVEFHTHLIKACLSIYYREEFERNPIKILQKYDIFDYNQDVIIITSRRAGKTTGTSLFQYANLAEVPCYKTNVYAHRLHIAEMIVQIVKTLFLASHDITGYKIVHNSKNLFEVQFPNELLTRKIQALAADPNVRAFFITIIPQQIVYERRKENKESSNTQSQLSTRISLCFFLIHKAPGNMIAFFFFFACGVVFFLLSFFFFFCCFFFVVFFFCFFAFIWYFCVPFVVLPHSILQILYIQRNVNCF